MIQQSVLSDTLKASFLDGQRVLKECLEDGSTIEKTAQLSTWLADAFNSNKKALICGNGGSACDAMHFAEEFTGRYRQSRRPLPVIALSDPSHITCVGNDYGFDYIFQRGVEAFGQAGDVFIGLSTSGNSQNVVHAFNSAKEQGLKTVLLLGKTGGTLKGQADLEWIVPGTTSDRIQELHMMILHIAIEGVERILFPDHYES